MSFGFSVERELVEGRYVTYDLEVCADITPPGGDGWNEPRYNAYAECCARVDSLVILRAETDAEVKICSGFIGPMEPGVVGPGRYLELAKSELEHASDTALERAEDYPDPDEAYDSARGEF